MKRSIWWLLAGTMGCALCAGCGGSSRAPEFAELASEPRVFLPGCEPYKDRFLRLLTAEMLLGKTASGAPFANEVAAGKDPAPIPIQPERLRERAVVLQRWASEARESSAVETPWGTPSVDLADRFDALALQVQNVADAADKKDDQAIEEARTALSETLKGFSPLISTVKGRCFVPAPVPASGPRKVSDILPPAVIQGTVHTRNDRFRQCYEAGLGRNPELTGRVTPRFVIAHDGTVPWVALDSATLPDKQVVDCIVSGFTNLVFPAPIGGFVTVVYPINFSPDVAKK